MSQIDDKKKLTKPIHGVIMHHKVPFDKNVFDKLMKVLDKHANERRNSRILSDN
jgi:hypothetical protein